MADSHFAKVERAFQAAVAARESGERPDVTALCAGDAAVAAEVRTLLRHLGEAGEVDRSRAANTDLLPGSKAPGNPFLDPAELHAGRPEADEPDRRAMLDEWGASAVGQRVGEFTLVQPIGAGGMGVVFVARQERPSRTVALKLIRRTAATPALIRRFEREAQVLGRLNHPGIAQVYAAGVADLIVDSGATVRAPYIAMELVQGLDVLSYVRGRFAEPVLVLRLVASVCDAIQHAHQRGVIHRDLKPANVLVTTGADGQPHVKVLDFGVARETEGHPDHAETRLTYQGHLIGTLAYMSPEQVAGGDRIDTRCDVYALGVMLYQMLTGRLPIDVAGCPIAEAARRITHESPTPVGTLDRSFRGDVDTIVARALEKDPARRYESPAALARDIRHYLAGEMIEARRDSVIYLLRKRVERYRNMALAAILLLGTALAFALYARHQEKLQERAKHEALLAKSDADVARRRADDTAEDMAAELSAVRIEQGRLLGQSDLTAAERLLWDEMFEHPDSLYARWALRELYWRTGCVRTFAAHAGPCLTLSVAPGQDRFATGGEDGFVRLWSLPGGQKVGEFPSGGRTTHAVRFSPDGRRIGVAGTGGAYLYDFRSGARQPLGPAGLTSYALQFAPNGKAVAVGSDDGLVRLFDPADGAELAAIPQQEKAATRPATPDPLRAVDIDPACGRLAAVYLSGQIRLWHLSLAHGRASVSPGPKVDGHKGSAGIAIRFSPDGTTLASGGTDRSVKLWGVGDGASKGRFITWNGTARSIEFTPDGRRLVVPGYWRTQIFEVESGKTSAMGDAGGYAGQFASGGQRLLVGGTDGTCRIWDFGVSPTTVFKSTAWLVRDLAVAAVDGKCVLASIQADGELRVREGRAAEAGAAAPQTWVETLHRNVGDRARSLAMTADGALVTVGREDGRLVTIRTRDGATVHEAQAHQGVVNTVRLSPDGRTLVTGGVDKTARLWSRRPGDVGAWKPGPTLPCEGEVLGAAFHPDGAVVATTSRTNSLRFWSVPGGKLLRHVVADKLPWNPIFTPAGHWLAAGSWDLAIRFWDARPLVAPSAEHPRPVRHEHSLYGHSQLVRAQAFDAGGDLMASVSNDGALRIWDVADLPPNPSETPRPDRRRCIATFDAGAGDAYAVTFLPPAAPGRRAVSVAVGYIDGTVRVWDLDSLDGHLRGHVDHQRQLRNRPAVTDGGPSFAWERPPDEQAYPTDPRPVAVTPPRP